MPTSTFSWYNSLFYSLRRRRSTLVLTGTSIPLIEQIIRCSRYFICLIFFYQVSRSLNGSHFLANITEYKGLLKRHLDEGNVAQFALLAKSFLLSQSSKNSIDTVSTLWISRSRTECCVKSVFLLFQFKMSFAAETQEKLRNRSAYVTWREMELI